MGNIELEVKDKIALVTLSKKPFNLVNREYYTEIRYFMQTLNLRNDVNVVILKSGCKCFCAGGDLDEVKNIVGLGDDFAKAACNASAESIGSILNSKKPVIAAVNGKAIGAGMAIAASCDIIIADEEAQFSVPEITVGMIGAAEYMQLLIPRRLARYYAFTGKPITAKEVKALGGILDVVPKDKLIDRAMEIAQEISRFAPKSISLLKQAMNDNDNERLAEKYLHGLEVGLGFYHSAEAKETVNAVLEKRKPVFTGK